SQLNFVRDTNEWDGTDIVFEIAKKGDKTEVRFTHVGLVPTIECYDGCSGAWGFYVNESLRSFIAKGKGQPNPDERRPSRAKSRGEQRAHDSRRGAGDRVSAEYSGRRARPRVAVAEGHVGAHRKERHVRRRATPRGAAQGQRTSSPQQGGQARSSRG